MRLLLRLILVAIWYVTASLIYVGDSNLLRLLSLGFSVVLSITLPIISFRVRPRCDLKTFTIIASSFALFFGVLFVQFLWALESEPHDPHAGMFVLCTEFLFLFAFVFSIASIIACWRLSRKSFKMAATNRKAIIGSIDPIMGEADK